MARRKKAVQQAQRVGKDVTSRVYSRDNVARYAKRGKQRRRGKLFKRCLLFTILGLFVGAVTAAGVWLYGVVGNLNNASIITESLLTTLVDSDVTQDPFYVLLLGTDGRNEDEVDRSDSIILARIDPVEKQVTLISIPRDTKVEYSGSTMKINAVYAYAGAAGMVQAVNELCGIEISHYAEIDFNGLVDLVDAVGGIWITVPEGDEIDDEKAGDVTVEAGYQLMDGETALVYCRARYQYTDGDYTRMRHQRQVIAALADQILNNLELSSVVSLVNSVSEMVVTDLSVSEILAIVNAMRGMDTSGMYTCNIPSWAGDDTYIDGVSYVFVYEDELAEMMARVDAGEDPEGSQTMGSSGSEGTTVADLSTNNSSDWVSGTATTGSDSDDEDASE